MSNLCVFEGLLAHHRHAECGAEAQAKQLARSGVKTVVAVSCDVASFARDAEILIGGGYVLKQVSAVDQFKWSAHVESVAQFQRPR